MKVGILFVICVLLVALPAYGYIANVVLLCTSDWSDGHHKEEVIRGVGCLVPPIGCIVGFFGHFDTPDPIMPDEV